MKQVKAYSPFEEKLNIYSHGFGLLLSIIGLVFVLTNPSLNTSFLHTFSFIAFALSLIVLYAASTFYHQATNALKRARLRVFDHAAIYILIAGTYTPFSLIAIGGDIGWTIFTLAWSMAISGVIFKLFFTGKFTIISTSLYVFMGGMIVFFIDDLTANLSSEGLDWLMLGGLAYIIGAIIYSIKAIKFNHAIFHGFVLIGSFSQFVSAYFYIV